MTQSYVTIRSRVKHRVVGLRFAPRAIALLGGAIAVRDRVLIRGQI
jgi:hypothetical protein